MLWLRERSPFLITSSILGTGMLFFLLAPLLGSLVNAAPGLSGVLRDERTLQAIFLSFYCALLATGGTLLFGVPLAYLFARHDFPGKEVVDALIDLPILIPHNAAGIALLILLSPRSWLGGVLARLGLRFLDTVLGIVIAMAFVSAPFMIRNAQEAFLAIPPATERVARSLGATNFQAFVYVTFPLAWRGILTGCFLTWARGVSEFGAVVMLAYFPKTAPIHLFDVFVSEGLRAAIPITGLLLLLALLLLSVLRVLTGKSSKPVTEGGG